MKNLYILVFLFAGCFLFAQKHVKHNNAYYFYENKGQILDQHGKPNAKVKYLFNSAGLHVQIKEEGFSYDVYEVEKMERKASKKNQKNLLKDNQKPEYDYKYRYHRVDVDFVNATANPEIVAEERSADYENFYTIPDRPEGVANVYRYKKITYKNLYPNVDLVFFKPKDTAKAVEYNFVVHPGGKISDIQLKFNGAKTKLQDGKLAMKLRFGEMQENIPHSWEEFGTVKNEIRVGFKDLGNQIFGFESSKNTSDKTMVIDPVPIRIWGSYYGGDENENLNGITTDNADFVYTYGFTQSHTQIATSGTYSTTYISSTYNNFVFKIDANGNKVWGTYINEPLVYFRPNDLKIADDFTLYIGGESSGNSGAKVYALTNAGALKKVVAFSGNGTDKIKNIAISNDGIYFVGSTTSSSGIATPGSFQDTNTWLQTGFIIKTDLNLNKLWGTYFGGVNCPSTELLTCNLDLNSNLQVFGTTQCNNLPLKNAFQNTSGGSGDGLYARFDKNGALLQSSYLGYTNTDFLYNGKITTDNKLILVGNFDMNFNDRQDGIFVIDLATNTILSKSFFKYRLNNTYTINYYSSFIDKDNNVYLAGTSNYGADIATPDAYQNAQFSNNPFIVKISPDGTKLWGTHYGGAIGGFDSVFFTKDKNEYLYMGGNVSANIGTDVSTNGTSPLGGWDIFIAKFKECGTTTLVNSSSPTCPGSTIQLTASGGTSYSWTGPNGFTSTRQNPTIPNATIANAGVYSCTITGTGNCDGTFTVTLKVEDKSAPIPNAAVLPTITGNCTTVITSIPTATDACAGAIVATTTSPLQYTLPGNYTITWSYDDGNGNISTQTQNVIIASEPLPIVNATQNFCQIANPKISNILIAGTAIKWYDALGNPLNANTPLVDGQKYYASQTLNGCESNRAEVLVSIQNPNSPTGNVLQTFCAASYPTVAQLVVNGQNVKWYTASNILLSATNPLIDGATYYASQTINGCESVLRLAVQVSITNGGIPGNDYPETFCNDTTANFKEVNLHDYEGNLITNPSDYSFDFYDAGNQQILDASKVRLLMGTNVFNIKISNALGCFTYFKLMLTMQPKPSISFLAEQEICDGQFINLDAGSGFTYAWTKDGNPTVIDTSQVLKVTTPGTYTVKITTNLGCENSATTVIKKTVLATLVRVDIINNNATVILSRSGDFLFSLDQLTWQNSNIFKNLSNGSHTVYVKTVGGCIIGFMTFSIFNVPNVFTPNADGVNDTWKIDGIENYPNSEISVFDRFGRCVLRKITNGPFEWDGKHNSQNLSTGNYWYIIKVSDGRLLSGWLLLKNRN